MPLLVCYSIRNANLINVERTLCNERVVASFSFHPRIQGNPILRSELRAALSVSLKMPKLNWVHRSSSVATLRNPAIWKVPLIIGEFVSRTVIWRTETLLRDTSCDRKSFFMSTINSLFPSGGFNRRNEAIYTRSINTTCEWIIKVVVPSNQNQSTERTERATEWVKIGSPKAASDISFGTN